MTNSRDKALVEDITTDAHDLDQQLWAFFSTRSSGSPASGSTPMCYASQLVPVDCWQRHQAA